MIDKGTVEIGKGIIKDGYNDLIHPSAEAMGQIASYLPRAIRIWFSGVEKWLINREETLRLTSEAIKEKVKKIPEDKLVEPETYVAVPAMQQLSYCQDSAELRDLYANLLASSMNADKRWTVHPAFVDIIKQLNPDEAKLLKTLIPISGNLYPLIDLVQTVNDNGQVTIYRNFTIQGIDKLEHPSMINSYIDNLCRLDLIEIPPITSLADSSIYAELENHPIMAKIRHNIGEENLTLSYRQKCFNLTDFGVHFIEVCC